MSINNKVADSLKTIGMNKYERNLWIALLARNSATAGELADISKVPRSRCYDVLESLADKGFVVLQPGKPIKYIAVQPREALERAKKRVQLDATETCSKIDRLVKSDAIKDLEKIFKEGFETVSPEELSGAIRGKDATLQQIESMMKKAKKYAKFVTTESGFNELAENYSSLFQRAAKSGVKIQIIAPFNKVPSEHAKNLMKHIQIRDMGSTEHIDKMLAKFCIIDGEETLLGLTDEEKIHETQHVAFWTQSRHATMNTFEPMFNLMWNNSKPLK
jgi:sugar-specific transcriptional regulator TrmB